MSLFGERLKTVSCKIWDATRADFDFPERTDPELQVTELESRPNAGLAFSGGGTRSAAATLGQLRGLDELGLLDKVRYLSCVSGGSWTCVPFTYLPDSWTDETFLGQVIPPRDVTLEYLQKTDRNSFAHCIANSVVIDDFVKQAARFAGDETYSRALGDTFLFSFGLDSLQRFFSLDQKSVSAILERNPNMTQDDFYQVRPGRPYLIVNSIILRTGNEPPTPQRIHFESTPLYAGSRVLHRGAGSSGRDIGGGYIEPFGFDSDEPEDPPNQAQTVRVRLGASRHRYTLSDVIGVSGAAPAEVLAQIGLDWLGFPEFKYWPLVDVGQVRCREYECGDGGILENLGIMPLLMRKVEHIVVFVNTRHKLRGGNIGQISDSIPPLFGQTPGFDVNHVFPKPKYKTLVQGLMAARDSGETVMFQDQYQVLENKHYGIAGGWEAEVLWVYNERVPAWEQKLRAEIRRLIGVGSLGSFPHYRTFFQNPPLVIDLSAKQVALLAHLSCWNVVENEGLFRGVLS
jgi:hypothetical protein